MKKSLLKKLLTILLVISAGFLIPGYFAQKKLTAEYNKQNSAVISDRNGDEIYILQNQKGNFARYSDTIPDRFKKMLVKKEDKYFYYHFGFNPVSIIRAGLARLGLGQKKASSTISQQLVKILLQKESERNLKNKITELFYTLSLETFKSKEEIIKMYANSAYFGNQAQGIDEAGRLYFGTDSELLSDGQILQLLATIPAPSLNNPAQDSNKNIALALANNLNLNNENVIISETSEVKKNMSEYIRSDDLFFELANLVSADTGTKTTIDKGLNEKVREIVKTNIEKLQPKNANNAAVIVVKLPENEILSLVGSPDPQSSDNGYKINMLSQPRPIGSTIKPFIYLKAFEKGLRPYTLVDDREYKYITALGFPLYPKNFDYKYRGQVTLHYALSNSLNVPAVKVLEYVGLPDFYDFLENDLGFTPVQPLGNYQLGIALGALEMKLTDLANYFTIFPNGGVLKPLKIYQGQNTASEKTVADKRYVQLVNKIINDRKTGIEQFGMVSELNLYQDNYALKTGTSRDFKDSWIVGFTPDFLVAVWVGNADNSATEGVSGQIGAGNIWSEIMQLLLASSYNKKTPFDFNLVKEFQNGKNIEYGLENDDFGKITNLLKNSDTSLILNPHDGDLFALEENTKIIFQAKEDVKWYLNGIFYGEGQNQTFEPKTPGENSIEAISPGGAKETVVIYIKESL